MVKGQGHCKRKCKDRFSRITSSNVDRFTSYQDHNDQQSILHNRGINFISGNSSFLADRSNGRDYATVLRPFTPSVRLSSVPSCLSPMYLLRLNQNCLRVHFFWPNPTRFPLDVGLKCGLNDNDSSFFLKHLQLSLDINKYSRNSCHMMKYNCSWVDIRMRCSQTAEFYVANKVVNDRKWPPDV